MAIEPAKAAAPSFCFHPSSTSWSFLTTKDTFLFPVLGSVYVLLNTLPPCFLACANASCLLSKRLEGGAIIGLASSVTPPIRPVPDPRSPGEYEPFCTWLACAACSSGIARSKARYCFAYSCGLSYLNDCMLANLRLYSSGDEEPSATSSSFLQRGFSPRAAIAARRFFACLIEHLPLRQMNLPLSKANPWSSRRSVSHLSHWTTLPCPATSPTCPITFASDAPSVCDFNSGFFCPYMFFPSLS